MLNYRFALWPFLIASLLVLPGCKRSLYHPQSFSTLSCSYSGQKTVNNVTVSVAPFSKKDSGQLFDQRGGRLHSKRKPLRPILMTIENQSDNTYIFNPKSLGIKLGNPRHAARRMYGHTSRRIIAPLLLGSLGATICFFGAAYLVILGTIHQVAMPALVKAGYSLLGISGIVAVSSPTISYYQGSHSYVANQKIDRDMNEKAIYQAIKIMPNSSESFLIFCQNRTTPTHWKIILNEQDANQNLIFDVEVQKGGMQCVH